MSLCEQIAAKLMAKERLSDQEQAHQKTCAECRDFVQAHRRLTNAFNQMRSIDVPRADDVEHLRRSFDAHLHAHEHRPLRVMRFGFATMVAVCVGLVGLWLWDGHGPSDEEIEHSSGQLLALLDEVDGIYATSDGDAHYPVQTVQLLGESSTELTGVDEGDIELVLPGAYNSLYEWFSDRS